MSLLEAEDLGETTVNTAEAHEGHCQQACGDEGDGHALHSLGNVHHGKLLADGSKDGEGETKAESCADGIDNTCEQVGLETLGIVGTLCHEDGYTEDAAVGGDEGQEDAECLVQGRRHFLQHDLHHLHEGSDDEDEGYGLQVDEVILDEQDLNEIGDNRGYGKHESNGCGHTEGGVHFLRHTEERADS